MLIYLLSIATVIFLAWIGYAFYRERTYRSKPYFRMSEIGWQKKAPAQEDVLVHAVGLLGDFGAVSTQGEDSVKTLVENWAEDAGPNSTLVFLGDNIYPTGLPPEGDRRRAHAEQVVEAQVHMLRNFQGKAIFLSGNHDWNKGKPDGLGYALRQEAYYRHRFAPPHDYLPRNGCPGPVALPLAEGVVMLVINTQWWVQRGDRPIGPSDGCESMDEEDFFLRFKQLLQQYRHQRIVVAAHHPLYSNALHGGKFNVKQHLFPLTAAHKKIYLPLPVAGSLYPLYRKYFGAFEDMSHPRYKRMRKRLLRIMHRHEGVVYAAGHDHNLQYFAVQQNHFLVSGSGSKLAYVKKGGKATFAHEEKGFMVLDYYASGEVWLRVLEPSLSPEGKPVPLTVFQKKLSPAWQSLPDASLLSRRKEKE